MTEFEYNLLVIQKDESVREYLVKLFDGKPIEAPLDTGGLFKTSDYMGTIEIQAGENSDKALRKLHIQTAGSSMDYILNYENHQLHAILLDLELPADQYAKPSKSTGMGLLKRIKSAHPHAQVIVITDQMIQDEAIEAIQNGAFYFIPQAQVLGMFVKALVSRIVEMKEAEFISYMDGLTGLYNKLYFHHLLTKILASYGTIGQEQERREQLQPLSLILIDIDDFKSFNDTYLHIDGDNALRNVAEVISTSFRAGDIKGRIGGDEFGVILPNTPHKEALKLCERFRRRITNSPVQLRTKKKDVSLTVSIGLATYPDPNSTLEKIFEEADKALMYGAKKLGRNIVCGYHSNNKIECYDKLIDVDE